MKTRFLTGDADYLTFGGKWISPKLNNGDFDYFLVIELINVHEDTGECIRDKYSVTVSAVSPQEAEKEIPRALRYYGLEEETSTELQIVDALHKYGVCALCAEFSGNNARKLLKQARDSLDMISEMFGFFMDSPKNSIGHTGWDSIKGIYQ